MFFFPPFLLQTYAGNLNIYTEPRLGQLETYLRHKLASTPLYSRHFLSSLDAALKAKGDERNNDDTSVGPRSIRVELVELGRNYPRDQVSIAFWQSSQGLSVQILPNHEGDGTVAMEGGEDYWKGHSLFRCGSANGQGNWSWPCAQVFRMEAGRWVWVTERFDMGTIETGPGTHFARRHGKANPYRIIVTGNEYPKFVNQPHAGPLLRVNHTWLIRGNRISPAGSKLIPTPLAELNRIAELAQKHRRTEFNRAVPVRYRTKLWTLLQNQISVMCPHDYEYSECDTLSVWRGGLDDQDYGQLAMHFAKVKGKWRLVRVYKSPRTD